MKQNQIDTLQKLKPENFENIFNIFKDKDNRYFYNLLQTIELPSNLPDGYYNTYTVKYQDTWPNISYTAYNTPNLWWVIVGANNIMDPTSIPKPGTILKIYKIEIINLIFDQITAQDT
jgi:nucleoid-associated protein YgaU